MKPTAGVSMTIDRRYTIRTGCRSPRRAANNCFARSRILSSCRSRASPPQCRRASDWCSDRGNKAIFRISMHSMNAGPAPGSTPKGEWGAGAVELVEIPSGRETNDNIVAFSGARRNHCCPGIPRNLPIASAGADEPAAAQGSWAKWSRPVPAPASTASGACSCWISSAPARKLDGLAPRSRVHPPARFQTRPWFRTASCTACAPASKSIRRMPM